MNNWERPCDFTVHRAISAVLALLALTLSGLSQAAQRTEPVRVWTRSVGGKVLSVINASPTMFAAPLSQESVLPGDGALGRFKFEERVEAFKDASSSDVVHVVETTSGIVVVVVEDRGDRVRLVGIGTEDGAAKWERTGLTLGKRGGFVTLGNLVLARVAQDESGKPLQGEYLLVAFDLHDGRTLWRNDLIQDESLRVVGLPQYRVALLQSLAGGGRLYAVDLDTGRIRWHLLRDNYSQVLLPFTGFASGNALNPEWAFVQTAENFFSYTSTGGDILVLTAEGSRTHPQPTLRSLDIESGATRWAYALPGEKWDPAVSIHVGADRVYAYRYELFLISIDRATGAVQAQSQAKGHRAWMGGRWLDPRRLYVQGDILLVAYPGGKDYQLRAFDTRTGSKLWETDKLKEGRAGLALVGNRVVFGSKDSIVILDPRSGTIQRESGQRLRSEVEFLFPGTDGSLVLQSRDQVAKVLVDGWKSVYDTGLLPDGIGPRGDWGAGREGAGALLAAILNTTTSWWGGSSGQAGAQNARARQASIRARFDLVRRSSATAATQTSVRATQESLEDTLITGDASGTVGTAGAASFFIAEGPDGKDWVLRVDHGTGERRFVSPFARGSWSNTVVDDYRGLAITVDKSEVSAHRFSMSDADRGRASLADAVGDGLESLLRAAALVQAKASAAAAQEVERGEARLRSALATARGSQEAGIRLRRVSALQWLADFAPQRAASLREEAKKELEVVISLAAASGDERLRAAAEIAKGILAGIRGEDGLATKPDGS